MTVTYFETHGDQPIRYLLAPMNVSQTYLDTRGGALDFFGVPQFLQVGDEFVRLVGPSPTAADAQNLATLTAPLGSGSTEMTVDTTANFAVSAARGITEDVRVGSDDYRVTDILSPTTAAVRFLVGDPTATQIVGTPVGGHPALGSDRSRLDVVRGVGGTTAVSHGVLEQISRVLSPDDFVSRRAVDYVSPPLVRGYFDFPLPTPTDYVEVIYSPPATLAEARLAVGGAVTSALCVAPERVRFNLVGRPLGDIGRAGYYVEVTLSRELDAAGVPIPFASRLTYTASGSTTGSGQLTFTTAPAATAEVSPFGAPVQGLDLLAAGTWRVVLTSSLI